MTNISSGLSYLSNAASYLYNAATCRSTDAVVEPTATLLYSRMSTGEIVIPATAVTIINLSELPLKEKLAVLGTLQKKFESNNKELHKRFSILRHNRPFNRETNRAITLDSQCWGKRTDEINTLVQTLRYDLINKTQYASKKDYPQFRLDQNEKNSLVKDVFSDAIKLIEFRIESLECTIEQYPSVRIDLCNHSVPLREEGLERRQLVIENNG
ncbi:hypothetical protein HOH87_02540 [bacterium]|jgi:hypothetical protein|nr:hypothetical protein [bacterium]